MFSGLSVALVTPMNSDGSLNENMLKMRLHEKETGKYSSIPINKGNDGFSMLTKKAVTAYVDLLEHTHIR